MGFSTINDNNIKQLHEAKAEMAEGLAVVVKDIVETGHNPENTLEDIIKLAHILDIAAPAIRTTPGSFSDPRFHLLDYIKRYAGARTLKAVSGDEILFDKTKPFTCMGQIQEIFLDVSDKITKHFVTVTEVQYA